MTKASMALADLAEKGLDADLLKQMIQFVAQRLMDMDVETLCGAGYGERSAERANSRNGYRERMWETRAGTIDLKLPKLRSGSYFPRFLEPRRTAAVQETLLVYHALGHDPATRAAGSVQAYERHLVIRGQ